MNSLCVLANELHEQAVADFKVSERFAYSFIMKVKRIRDERLYKELGYSSFDNYCETAWKTKRDFMDQRIQIAESFGETHFADTYRQLGHSKSLLLARMEPDLRQKVESKVDVSEATVRQLKEVQKRIEEEQLKAEAERRAKQAEMEKQTAIQQHSDEREKLLAQLDAMRKEGASDSPEILQRVKELEQQLELRANLLKKAEQELEALKLRDTSDYDEDEAKRQRQKLQHEADYNVLELRVHITRLLEKTAITGYMQGALAKADPAVKEMMFESIEMLENFTTQIKAALNGRIIGGNLHE
ncbi:hypothetical protein WDD9_003668 [Paenibacillus melissococcoides]|uniref:hypothetical protein n=2 Tax=Paenibacillus TaxID=44249 RepID=UPI001B11E6FF|nr:MULTISPECIES: hypothetical protein [Paenibacillus]MEB9896686.1 hypothetical protein [Bacillus cereus]GIO78443.1 hypothetical protein J6TS7_20530 [Paenibacillus dendritiformis]CAH8713806.1 hypothetical protein WDD9_003668 [Paenibacillus melissococcoides]CAH8720427.1 hypothetical protein HTL2_005939 [Paenibacillus melissococcoides]